jgi:hypothetical protein
VLRVANERFHVPGPPAGMLPDAGYHRFSRSGWPVRRPHNHFLAQIARIADVGGQEAEE